MARVPTVDPDDLDEEHRDLLVSRFQEKPLNLYATVGNNPGVLEGFRGYLESLWDEAGLSARERELVILAVANEADSEYELYQHVSIARDAGLSQVEIDAIAAGDDDPFTETETLLLTYARAVARGEVTDDLHDRLADAYDDATVVGIANLAGAYYGLAHVLDALDIQPED